MCPMPSPWGITIIHLPSSGSATTRETLFNEYFSADDFKKWPTFGGLMKEGELENSYHLFSAGGRDWIVLALEWGPRDETVAWANEVLQKYPKRKAILITHALSLEGWHAVRFRR